MDGMEEVAKRLALYHQLFLTCLLGMVVSLGVSIWLFVRLRMRDVMVFFMGRGHQKTVRTAEKKAPRKEQKRKKNKKQRVKRGREDTTCLLFQIEREILLVHTEEEIPLGEENFSPSRGIKQVEKSHAQEGYIDEEEKTNACDGTGMDAFRSWLDGAG